MYDISILNYFSINTIIQRKTHDIKCFNFPTPPSSLKRISDKTYVTVNCIKCYIWSGLSQNSHLNLSKVLLWVGQVQGGTCQVLLSLFCKWKRKWQLEQFNEIPKVTIFFYHRSSTRPPISLSLCSFQYLPYSVNGLIAFLYDMSTHKEGK